MRILNGYVVVISFFVVVTVYWFVSDHQKRVPSQIYSEEFSLDLDDLRSFKLKTLHSLQVNVIEGASQVSLVLPADICRHIAEIELDIAVEGLTVSGEPIQRQYRKPCHELNPENLAFVWEIPHKDLQEELAPLDSWVVKGFNFVGGRDGETSNIDITSYEIIYVWGSPVFLLNEPISR